MRVVRVVGAIAVVVWAVVLMTLLIPPHPQAPDAMQSLSGGFVVQDSELFEHMSRLPSSGPLLAIVLAVGVALLAYRAAKKAATGSREAFAFSAGVGVGALVPSVWVEGALAFDCLSPYGETAVVFAVFSVFGAAARFAVEPRWWAAVAVAPAVLGLVRFGVDCPTSLGVVAAGPLLGLLAAGVAGRRVPTGV